MYRANQKKDCAKILTMSLHYKKDYICQCMNVIEETYSEWTYKMKLTHIIPNFTQNH